MNKTSDIPLQKRLWLCGATWVVGFVASGAPYPELLHFAWAFPLGLLAFLIPEIWQRGCTAGAIAGWLFYAGLTIYCLRQQRRTRYFALYAILCACLVLNVVGCQTVIRTKWSM